MTLLDNEGDGKGEAVPLVVHGFGDNVESAGELIRIFDRDGCDSFAGEG